MSDNPFEYKVDAKFTNDEIMLEHGFAGERLNIAREIINLKDEAVKEALIKLGWIPPEDAKNSIPKSKIEVLDAKYDNLINEAKRLGATHEYLLWISKDLKQLLQE